jgi:hypothetical protein
MPPATSISSDTQLRHPGDAGNHRLVPFLEIDKRPLPQRLRLTGRVGNTGGETFGEPRCPVAGADECPQRADHVEDFGDRALVERVDGDPLADQRRDDIGLQIGEAENKVRPQIEDLPDIRRREGRDPRLVPPRLGRADTIAGDPTMRSCSPSR